MPERYKLLVVDDEKMVRDGLQNILDWTLYEIEMIGSAADGAEALEIIRTEEPEIIITDIYMPEMDGLELAEKAQEIVPRSKIIILSGYDDFNYAQSAIRKQVFDYILKPIKTDKLVRIIENVKKQIKAETDQIRNIEKLRRQLQENLPIIRERYLLDIIKRRVPLVKVLDNYPYLGLHLERINFVVVMAQIDPITTSALYSEAMHLSLYSLKGAVENILPNEMTFEVFEDYPDKVGMVLNYDPSQSKQDLLENIETMGNKIINAVRQVLGIQVTVGVGNFYEEPENISESYQEALDALEYQVFLGKGTVIFIGDVSIKESNPYVYPFELQEKMIVALKISDLDRIAPIVEEFMCQSMEKNIPPRILKEWCFHFMFSVVHAINQWAMFWEYKTEKTADIERELKNATDCEEIQNVLADICLDLGREISAKKRQKDDLQINKAIRYIDENYMRDLSLENIAEVVYLTPNYFAKIFKGKTAVTVIGYLTQVRMEKAKQLLLETNDKVYEIAQKVGYKESTYFGLVFKKHTGLSPLQFREYN